MVSNCLRSKWADMSSVFLRNAAYKQKQYSKSGHWDFKYREFHHLKVLDHYQTDWSARELTEQSLAWLSLCPSWHSPRVLAINQPGHGRCCRAHSSLGITQATFLHTGWRESPWTLPCFGQPATHSTSGSLCADTACVILNPSSIPI